jgi:hypothetical protein
MLESLKSICRFLAAFTKSVLAADERVYAFWFASAFL